MNESFDYNLIKYLVAIVDTRSMVKASEVLDTAPAAVSYAVSKLRKHYNDPLFIRSRDGVKPTTLAMNLYEIFSPINQSILEQVTATDAVSKPIFNNPLIKIRTNSIVEYWLTHYAIKSHIVPEKCVFEFAKYSNSLDERINSLRTQEIDIDIGTSMPADRNIVSMPLFNFDLTLICRIDHPRIKETISLEQFSQESYVSRAFQENANIVSEMENVLDSRATQPWIKSESFINLLLNIIDNDLIMFFPKFLIPLITKNFPIKEVHCDFIKKKELYFYAYMHKKRSKESIMSDILGLMRQK
ncbi:LysR family transcriptional regulator [Leminorella grimontii]|uniref:LysR family transcriptional regulator n=1 Tax=Leminorella grimontii TaxID=82981 RepID=UPI00207F516E|nr:LysR family transcriptional regulator [Leminorella grimontii]GKX58663.1 LysR family transcriptional regulator [Leminorella grimontii]